MGMGRQSYFAMMNTDEPTQPTVRVKTLKEFRHGAMVNGIHQEHWVPAELTLAVCTRIHRPVTCGSCGALIWHGEVYGDGQLNFPSTGSHCNNCIEIPAGVTAMKVSYKMERRSKNNPDGVKSFFVVAQADAARAYIETLTAALSRPVFAETIATFPEDPGAPAT